MNALVPILCILYHCCNSHNDTCFKYVSSKDTLVILESDIVNITIDSNDYWTFLLNEQMFNEFSGIQDTSGCLYFFCEKSNRWIPVPVMRWYDSAIPTGWYVQADKSGHIVNDNKILRLRFDRIYKRKKSLCMKMLSKKRKRQIRKLSLYN